MSVRFLSGINVDQNTFVVDDANNRVGINVASPQYTFHVSGDAYVTGRIYDSAQSSGTSGQVLSSTGTGTSWISPTLGTVTSIDITAGAKLSSSGGPITSSGSITVAHVATEPADLPTMTSFIAYVQANGGVVEAVGPVGQVIATLTGATVQTATSNTGGTVLQNIAVDDYGHVFGVSSVTLDTDDIIEGSSNLYFTTARARASVSAGTGISYNSTTGVITNSAPDQTVVLTGGTGISTSGTYPNFTITNTAPDQTVTLTGAGTTSISGSYPNFTITSNDQYDGTVTSVDITAGSRIVSSGGPITTSGAITVSHGVAGGADVTTAQAFRLRVIADGGTFEAFNEVAIAIGSLEDIATPQDTDNSGGTVLQNIVLDEFGHILGVGAITLDTDDIVEGSSNLYYTDARARAALSAGTGISYNSTSGVITNSAPDQTVVLTAGTGISTSGTYPNFTITNSAPDQTVVLTAGTGISTSGSYPNFTITNSAPDQTVVLTGAGTTTITGTYPNFTITSNDQYVGTVTSVGLTAGTGISVSGSPITSSGSITVTNTAPDQTVVLTAGTGITTSGTYPNFTITNAAPDQTVALTAGTGISVTGTYPNFTITNSSPSSGGTVTSIDLTAGAKIGVSGGPVTTSGSITVEHLATEPADLPTMTSFITYVQANGGIVEAVGPVGQVIAALTGATVTTATSNTGGNVLQNIAIDDYGHVFGISSTDLDDRYAQEAFKTIAVSGQSDIVADAIADTLTIAAGTGVTLTTNASTDTLTITNSAPDQTVALTAGTGISVSGTYPNFTITNSSPSSGGTVTSINLTAGDRIDVSGGPITTSGSITVTHGVADGADFVTAQDFEARVLADGGIFEALGEVAIAIGSLDDAASPSSTDYNDGFVIQNIAVDEFGHVLGVGATDLDDRYAQVAFKNIAVSGQTTIEADAIEDTLTVAAGTGISVTTTAGSDTLTITNSDTGSAQNIFKNIAVSGQSTVVADSNNDTLTLAAGTGISITTSAATDTITITNSQPANPAANTDSLNFKASTPYTVISPFDPVIIDSNPVELIATNTVTESTKMMAIVTLEVANTDSSTAFTGFTLRLYNSTDAAAVSGASIRWSAYMYPAASEFGYTSFTYHIPIDDTNVTVGDTIELQLQLEVGACEITNVSFTLMAITN